jgi:secreted PhoX family phosphatase
VKNPQSLAIDGIGQVWIANNNSSISVLSSSGEAISPTGGYTGAGLSHPGGLTIDLSGNVWITNSTDNSVTEIIGGAAPVAPLSSGLTNGTTGARP